MGSELHPLHAQLPGDGGKLASSLPLVHGSDQLTAFPGIPA